MCKENLTIVTISDDESCISKALDTPPPLQENSTEKIKQQAFSQKKIYGRRQLMATKINRIAKKLLLCDATTKTNGKSFSKKLEFQLKKLQFGLSNTLLKLTQLSINNTGSELFENFSILLKYIFYHSCKSAVIDVYTKFDEKKMNEEFSRVHRALFNSIVNLRDALHSKSSNNSKWMIHSFFICLVTGLRPLQNAVHSNFYTQLLLKVNSFATRMISGSLSLCTDKIHSRFYFCPLAEPVQTSIYADAFAWLHSNVSSSWSCKKDFSILMNVNTHDNQENLVQVQELFSKSLFSFKVFCNNVVSEKVAFVKFIVFNSSSTNDHKFLTAAKSVQVASSSHTCAMVVICAPRVNSTKNSSKSRSPKNVLEDFAYQKSMDVKLKVENTCGTPKKTTHTDATETTTVHGSIRSSCDHIIDASPTKRRQPASVREVSGTRPDADAADRNHRGGKENVFSSNNNAERALTVDNPSEPEEKSPIPASSEEVVGSPTSEQSLQQQPPSESNKCQHKWCNSFSVPNTRDPRIISTAYQRQGVHSRCHKCSRYLPYKVNPPRKSEPSAASSVGASLIKHSTSSQTKEKIAADRSLLFRRKLDADGLATKPSVGVPKRARVTEPAKFWNKNLIQPTSTAITRYALAAPHRIKKKKAEPLTFPIPSILSSAKNLQQSVVNEDTTAKIGTGGVDSSANTLAQERKDLAQEPAKLTNAAAELQQTFQNSSGLMQKDDPGQIKKQKSSTAVTRSPLARNGRQLSLADSLFTCLNSTAIIGDDSNVSSFPNKTVPNSINLVRSPDRKTLTNTDGRAKVGFRSNTNTAESYKMKDLSPSAVTKKLTGRVAARNKSATSTTQQIRSTLAKEIREQGAKSPQQSGVVGHVERINDRLKPSRQQAGELENSPPATNLKTKPQKSRRLNCEVSPSVDRPVVVQRKPEKQSPVGEAESEAFYNLINPDMVKMLKHYTKSYDSLSVENEMLSDDSISSGKTFDPKASPTTSAEKEVNVASSERDLRRKRLHEAALKKLKPSEFPRSAPNLLGLKNRHVSASRQIISNSPGNGKRLSTDGGSSSPNSVKNGCANTPTKKPGTPKVFLADHGTFQQALSVPPKPQAGVPRKEGEKKAPSDRVPKVVTSNEARKQIRISLDAKTRSPSSESPSHSSSKSPRSSGVHFKTGQSSTVKANDQEGKALKTCEKGRDIVVRKDETITKKVAICNRDGTISVRSVVTGHHGTDSDGSNSSHRSILVQRSTATKVCDVSVRRKKVKFPADQSAYQFSLDPPRPNCNVRVGVPKRARTTEPAKVWKKMPNEKQRSSSRESSDSWVEERGKARHKKSAGCISNAEDYKPSFYETSERREPLTNKTKRGKPNKGRMTEPGKKKISKAVEVSWENETTPSLKITTPEQNKPKKGVPKKVRMTEPEKKKLSKTMEISYESETTPLKITTLEENKPKKVGPKKVRMAEPEKEMNKSVEISCENKRTPLKITTPEEYQSKKVAPKKVWMAEPEKEMNKSVEISCENKRTPLKITTPEENKPKKGVPKKVRMTEPEKKKLSKTMEISCESETTPLKITTPEQNKPKKVVPKKVRMTEPEKEMNKSVEISCENKRTPLKITTPEENKPKKGVPKKVRMTEPEKKKLSKTMEISCESETTPLKITTPEQNKPTKVVPKKVRMVEPEKEMNKSVEIPCENKRTPLKITTPEQNKPKKGVPKKVRMTEPEKKKLSKTMEISCESETTPLKMTTPGQNKLKKVIPKKVRMAEPEKEMNKSVEIPCENKRTPLKITTPEQNKPKKGVPKTVRMTEPEKKKLSKTMEISCENKRTPLKITTPEQNKPKKGVPKKVRMTEPEKKKLRKTMEISYESETTPLKITTPEENKPKKVGPKKVRMAEPEKEMNKSVEISCENKRTPLKITTPEQNKPKRGVPRKVRMTEPEKKKLSKTMEISCESETTPSLEITTFEENQPKKVVPKNLRILEPEKEMNTPMEISCETEITSSLRIAAAHQSSYHITDQEKVADVEPSDIVLRPGKKKGVPIKKRITEPAKNFLPNTSRSLSRELNCPPKPILEKYENWQTGKSAHSLVQKSTQNSVSNRCKIETQTTTASMQSKPSSPPSLSSPQFTRKKPEYQPSLPPINASRKSPQVQGAHSIKECSQPLIANEDFGMFSSSTPLSPEKERLFKEKLYTTVKDLRSPLECEDTTDLLPASESHGAGDSNAVNKSHVGSEPAAQTGNKKRSASNSPLWRWSESASNGKLMKANNGAPVTNHDAVKKKVEGSSSDGQCSSEKSSNLTDFRIWLNNSADKNNDKVAVRNSPEAQSSAAATHSKSSLSYAAGAPVKSLAQKKSSSVKLTEFLPPATTFIQPSKNVANLVGRHRPLQKERSVADANRSDAPKTTERGLQMGIKKKDTSSCEIQDYSFVLPTFSRRVRRDRTRILDFSRSKSKQSTAKESTSMVDSSKNVAKSHSPSSNSFLTEAATASTVRTVTSVKESTSTVNSPKNVGHAKSISHSPSSNSFLTEAVKDSTVRTVTSVKESTSTVNSPKNVGHAKSIRYSPSSNSLLTGTVTDSTVRTVTSVKESTSMVNSPKNAGHAKSIRYSPSSNSFLTGTVTDSTVRTVTSVKESTSMVNSPKNAGHAKSIRYSPSSNSFLTGTVTDSTVRTVTSVKESTSMVNSPKNAGHAKSIRYSPSSNSFFTGTVTDSTVTSVKESTSMVNSPKNVGLAKSIRYSPSSNSFFTGTVTDSTVRTVTSVKESTSMVNSPKNVGHAKSIRHSPSSNSFLTEAVKDSTVAPVIESAVSVESTRSSHTRLCSASQTKDSPPAMKSAQNVSAPFLKLPPTTSTSTAAVNRSHQFTSFPTRPSNGSSRKEAILGRVGASSKEQSGGNNSRDQRLGATVNVGGHKTVQLIKDRKQIVAKESNSAEVVLTSASPRHVSSSTVDGRTNSAFMTQPHTSSLSTTSAVANEAPPSKEPASFEYRNEKGKHKSAQQRFDRNNDHHMPFKKRRFSREFPQATGSSVTTKTVTTVDASGPRVGNCEAVVVSRGLRGAATDQVDSLAQPSSIKTLPNSSVAGDPAIPPPSSTSVPNNNLPHTSPSIANKATRSDLGRPNPKSRMTLPAGKIRPPAVEDNKKVSPLKLSLKMKAGKRKSPSRKPLTSSSFGCNKIRCNTDFNSLFGGVVQSGTFFTRTNNYEWSSANPSIEHIFSLPDDDDDQNTDLLTQKDIDLSKIGFGKSSCVPICVLKNDPRHKCCECCVHQCCSSQWVNMDLL